MSSMPHLSQHYMPNLLHDLRLLVPVNPPPTFSSLSTLRRLLHHSLLNATPSYMPCRAGSAIHLAGLGFAAVYSGVHAVDESHDASFGP